MRYIKHTQTDQVCSYRPTLDYREDQRRSKLHAVLRDVRRVLDHDARCEAPELGALITLAVAEIAVIERVSDPMAGCAEYHCLIAECLGLDPWDAVALWNVHAVEPIRANAARWTAHVAQASLKAEPTKHHHVKLLAVEDLARALNVTRPRIKAIFGSDRCALPPTLVRKGRFDNETLARLRRIAKDHGKTPEYVGDLLIERGPDALAAMVEVWKSDAARKWERKGQIGRPPDPSGVRSTVASVAKHRRVSDSTIYREARVRKACKTPESDCVVTPETPEFFVTMTAKLCHDDSESLRSATPDFSHVFKTEIPFSDTHLVLGEIAMHLKRRRRSRYEPEDVALLKEWWRATRGTELADPTIRQWMHRNKYVRNFFAAQAWRELVEIAAAADLKPIHTAPETIPNGTAFPFEDHTDADPTRSVRFPGERAPFQGEETAARTEASAHGRG